jgi:hypothetical protein
MYDGLVIYRSKFLDAPKGGQKMRAYQYACFMLLGRGVPNRHVSLGDMRAYSNVLAKESWKEGVRNCFLHLGELVSNIRDDSLDKLPFLLQRSLQARIGCSRLVLGRRG